jgi:restriction system protein
MGGAASFAAVGDEDPTTEIPSQFDLMWPTVEALRLSGGSATISEIADEVIRSEGFTEEQQAIKRKPGDHMSMIEYRLAWARNGLKLAAFIENSSRGVWALTEAGRQVPTEDALLADVKRWRAEYNRRYLEKKRAQADTPAATEDEFDEKLDEESDPDWRDTLLDRLLQMSPSAFERLAQRVLREAGFRDVQVLGRSNDGGIDGVGTLRVSLISFPIYFQCKRYRDSVGSGAVRDFRGAMAGRGEKGLLITTGTFTREAQNEANRDGAPPIELVSGQDLAELLRTYDLGVRTELQEVMTVETAFFDQFE